MKAPSAAAATVGSLGETLTDFAALRKAGAVAVTDDGKPVLDDRLMRDALSAAAKLNMPVVQHAEDTRMTAVCSMNLGAASFRLGLHGMSNAAESSIVERDIALAGATRGHLHVAHLSTREALEAERCLVIFPAGRESEPIVLESLYTKGTLLESLKKAVSENASSAQTQVNSTAIR